MLTEIAMNTLIAEIGKGIGQVKAFIDGKLNLIPITWDLLVYRFKEWRKEYPKAVGFVIVELAEEGNYSIVQGMINQDTSEVYIAVRIESKYMDDKARDVLLNGPKIKIFS